MKIQRIRSTIAAILPSRLISAAISGMVLLTSACADVTPTASVAPDARMAVSATSAESGGSCVKDSKFLGLTKLSSVDARGTWWYLTRNGLNQAGITTESGYITAMNGWFGQTFATLDEAVSFLVSAASVYDTNGNGYICAYEVRGTRAHTGDPNFGLYAFLVRDDK